MGFENFLPSGNNRLDSQLEFTAEIDKMTSVLRQTLLVNGSRRENDAEHSWHISVMALLFEEYAIEKPDITHAMEMCMVHDLVEILLPMIYPATKVNAKGNWMQPISYFPFFLKNRAKKSVHYGWNSTHVKL